MVQTEFCATDYANELLAQLGAEPRLERAPEVHPALRWAQCGAMVLTGYPRDAPQMCPVPLASYADGIVAALQSVWPCSGLAALDGARLLGERAALAGYTRAGDASPGGSCRLLQCADGWLAVNLARDCDWQLLPAWLETGRIADWDALAAALRDRRVEACVDRGRVLGLAVAAMRPRSGHAANWCRETYRVSGGSARVPGTTPVVVDLSSLWAGPLCTHLLQMMGAYVIKVESTSRPDGMRGSGDRFFDLLNAGKASVALELTNPQGRGQLRQLIASADIVVEAARPRALRQFGIHAETMLDEHPGLTWISITGHGRGQPEEDWVAFGDDGAVAGGLSQVLWDAAGRAMFGADAIADPLTGLHAALAAAVGYQHGGGRLFSLALADVVAFGISQASLGDTQSCRSRTEAWAGRVRGSQQVSPGARPVPGRAREFGADTREVLAGHA
jgi:hypothetical protein